MSTNARLNNRSQLASVSVALVLVAVKLWAFGMTGSLAIAASLADSGLDLMVSLAGLAAIRYAQRPPDADHTFGHSSAEDLAALGQSIFITVSAAAIAVAALGRIGDPPDLANEVAGIAVMGLSILLTLALVAYQTRVARQTGNRVIMADRLHYVGDLIPNVGALVALGAASAFGLTALDSIIALAAAGILAVGAVRIGAGAWDALMDRAAPEETIAGIEALAADHPGLEGFHDLRTRTAGSHVFVNMHVEIDGTLTLQEAHDIGESLRARILERYPETDVIIHQDPA